MDMRALKVGQKVRIEIASTLNEATVTEVTDDYVQAEVTQLSEKVLHGFAVDFHYDGWARVWEWVDASSDNEYTVVNEDGVCKFCIGIYMFFSDRETSERRMKWCRRE
jgi:hypothetical protein